MSREIRSRLGVARVLLQQTIGTIQQRTVSSSQRQALIAEISCIHLTATDAPALLELCRSVPWARVEDGDAVESALQAAVRAPRRGMQDFMAIPDYLLQLEWDHLNAETATLTSRCDLLLNRVIRNGGRCISEHSFKRVTSMLMLTSESAERLAVMSRGQKHDVNNFVKDEIQKLTRVAAAPAQYLEVLPSNFELFLQTTKGNQAYRAGQVPVRCPLDFLEQIRSMETSFKCRGVGSVAQSMQLANAGGGGQAPLLQLGAGAQLERFAGLIFAGMGQMQDTQNRLLQAFTSSPQRNIGSPLSSHSLMASSSRP